MELSGNNGGNGTIGGVLNINSGATVLLNAGDAIGYAGGTNSYVTAININGGLLYMTQATWDGFTTNFNLTGGTMSGIAPPGGPYWPAYNLAPGYGITTYASTATSLIGTCIYGRGGNVPFNVASGTTASGVDLNVTGVVFDNGAGITKSGPGFMQLAGANVIQGTTTVSGGTLQLGDGATTNSALFGNIADNATFVFANPFAETYGLSISGSGNLVKSGAGTLILSGNNWYSGTTTVAAGG